MLHYKLRTLLILLAVGPPLLAVLFFAIIFIGYFFIEHKDHPKWPWPGFTWWNW
jgi:hypothetical protein